MHYLPHSSRWFYNRLHYTQLFTPLHYSASIYLSNVLPTRVEKKGGIPSLPAAASSPLGSWPVNSGALRCNNDEHCERNTDKRRGSGGDNSLPEVERVGGGLVGDLAVET